MDLCDAGQLHSNQNGAGKRKQQQKNEREKNGEETTGPNRQKQREASNVYQVNGKSVWRWVSHDIALYILYIHTNRIDFYILSDQKRPQFSSSTA